MIDPCKKNRTEVTDLYGLNSAKLMHTRTQCSPGNAKCQQACYWGHGGIRDCLLTDLTKKRILHANTYREASDNTGSTAGIYGEGEGNERKSLYETLHYKPTWA